MGRQFFFFQSPFTRTIPNQTDCVAGMPTRKNRWMIEHWRNQTSEIVKLTSQSSCQSHALTQNVRILKRKRSGQPKLLVSQFLIAFSSKTGQRSINGAKIASASSSMHISICIHYKSTCFLHGNILQVSFTEHSMTMKIEKCKVRYTTPSDPK